jgi:hypothetical protein
MICFTPMKRGIIFITLLAASMITSGCRSYTAYVYSAVDPEYSISKKDPIWVTLTENPTIRERQLFIVLKSELQKGLFNIVDDKNESKYVLSLSADRKIYNYGTTSVTSAVAISPNLALSKTSNDINTVDKTTIYLYLFNTSEFTNGKFYRIWEGSVGATQNVYNVYKTAMFKNLLDVFGNDFEHDTRLSRSYVNSTNSTAKNSVNSSPDRDSVNGSPDGNSVDSMEWR